MAKKVLIAGESWFTVHTHVKGFDYFQNTTYEEGVGSLRNALESGGFEITYLPNHLADRDFPTTVEELQQYEVVYLSDIGANTLLLHPETFAKSIRTPNRLDALEQYTKRGGGLCMVGGYLTFQGIEAKGRWHGTQVEQALPVKISPLDDRVEAPQGVYPLVTGSEHPILSGLGEWPHFLGYNQLSAKPEATELLKVGEDAFLTVWEYGEGRSAAFASDCAPHWGPPEFVNWSGYTQFWIQLTEWLTGRL